uniref:Reverse transcriptase domain-containing protein n=1 Tax=Tanacetum cinerariifolium TaxID=118510 RepID=A0A6L2JUC5_TANCI|nr:reverse transcriptase domain-containing protein [Tanacetum cinerariifolium]
MARTPMNEHCSTVILNKLPRKLGDPGKFLIPCEFPGMDECLALADLGASINLMPFFVWEALSLLELTPTCMTLELSDRSVSKPISIAKDVSFKVAITYNLDQTVRYSANYNQMTANKIDVIYEMYSQEVLGFSNTTASDNPTPHDEPIVSTTSPTLTPFGDSDFLLFEETDAFLGLEDDPDSPKINPFYYDPEGDILLLEAILNSEPLPPLPNHEQYSPSFKKELKVCEAKTVKSSVDEPPEFWDTVQYDKSAGCYRCQLDEQWFVLTKDTLREALRITPVDNNQAFICPLSSDALINFGVITRSHIDYAERIWEEFTQSIHTFIDDKRNLTQHTSWKKKANLIVIPSIRFTKLIIHHLQRKHKLHPRPDSPLYLPNEEPVLGYLKFSAKGTKRKVLGMPTSGSDPDSPAPKPTKPARKPKSMAPKAPPRPSVSIPVTSAQPEPTSAPAKPQRKKRKLTTETSDKPSKAEKPKYGFVSKKRTMKSVAESVVEDAPAKELQVYAEDADMKKALKESLKSMYDVPRGPLPPVVIREPESGKYQPLLEVLGKGKAKSDSEEESKKVVPGVNARGQSEGHVGPDPGAQAEGQMGPNADPGNVRADEQHMPSPVIHAGSDREHMDLDVADVSPQPSTEQMDEGFTATAYPKVQENLKLMVEEQVLLKEPASSSGTLSSLQHPSKDLSFGDLFFSDKPSEADNDKATVETEVESMVTVTIQQDMSSIPPMTSPIIDLTTRPESPKAMQAPLRNRFRDLPKVDMKEILHKRMWETEFYKSHKDHMQLYEALKKSMNRDHSEELAQDLAKARKKKKNMPPPLPPPSYTNHESQSKGSAAPSFSKTAALAEYQAWTMIDIRLRLSISLTPADLQMDKDMAPDEQAQSSDDEYIRSAYIPKVNLRQDWWKPLKEERPTTPEPAWSIPSSDVTVLTNKCASALASNYSPSPKDSLLVQTGDIAIFMNSFCKRRGITELKPQDLEGPAFEIVKVFHPDVIHLQYQMEECHKLLTDRVDDSILRHNVSKPLPLGGPHGQVIIQTNFFFNKDLEYLRYDSKGIRPALSISKMKATYYPDVGLEQMVPDQFWIEEKCKYNIAAMKDVDRSKAFMFAIQKQLKTRRIFRNLESFVGGRVRYGDYRLLKHSSVGSPICAKLFQISMHILKGSKSQNRRDLPRDNPLVRVEVLGKIKSENKGRVPTEMELEPEHTQQGFSYEVSKHLLLSGIEDSVMDSVTHKFNPSGHSRYLNKLLFHLSLSFMHFYRLSHSELVDIEKVAVCSSLRSLKPKRTIKSKAKRSSKIISLGHYSIMLASSHTMKSKTDIKSPTHYPCVIDFDADPRVPLILGRSFLKTERALIDVLEGELTLRVGKEAITFNLDQTLRYSANYNDMTANQIDVIDMAYEDDFLLEKVNAFLALEDDPTLPEVDQSYFDTEGDILLLEAFHSDDPSLPPPNQGNYLPQVRKELKICEAKTDKSSIDEPLEVELKDLPPHLEYAFLKGDDKWPVIIAKDLRDELDQERSKKQKIEDENESAELKRCLEIVLDDGDDVTINATPLSSKSSTIVDYKIYKEGRKSFF